MKGSEDLNLQREVKVRCMQNRAAACVKLSYINLIMHTYKVDTCNFLKKEETSIILPTVNKWRILEMVADWTAGREIV